MSGRIKNELDLSVDSRGTVRSHIGSGGSTAINGLDYRVDLVGTKMNGHIDDIRTKSDRRLHATELPRHGNLSRHSWLSNIERTLATHIGVHRSCNRIGRRWERRQRRCRGSSVSTFDGSTFGPVTIDRRTLKTNYNVLVGALLRSRRSVGPAPASKAASLRLCSR